MLSITLVTVKRELGTVFEEEINFLKTLKTCFCYFQCQHIKKTEMHPSSEQQKKAKTKPCKWHSMRPPRNVPRQHSVFLHKPACPLQHLCHPHRCPKQVPGITLNSSSSWIPTINHSPSPPVSAKGSGSITSPDGLAGVVDPPLPPSGSHLSSSLHSPSPDITACSDSSGVSDLGASAHFPFHYGHCGRRKRSHNWYSLLWWDVC